MAMSAAEVAMLAVIISAFVLFAAVLAWASTERLHAKKSGARIRDDSHFAVPNADYALYDD
jgi:hypothetical protein